ncbi:MAG: hypothetical protein ACYSUX_07420 [Planctomycetota bacterium]|jgi:hypothetical protein
MSKEDKKSEPETKANFYQQLLCDKCGKTASEMVQTGWPKWTCKVCVEKAKSEPEVGEFTEKTTLMDIAVQLHNIYEPSCTSCSYSENDWEAVKKVILPVIDRLSAENKGLEEAMTMQSNEIKSTIAELIAREKDLAELSKKCHELGNEATGYKLALEAKDERIKELRQNLIEFGRHSNGCIGRFDPHPCKCGWKEVEQALKEATDGKDARR